MRVLITGGCGFIGSHLCELLSAEGHELIIIDDLSTGKISNLSGIKHQYQFIQSRVEEFDLETLDIVDVVVHLAAQASVPISISQFYMSSKTNLLSSLSIIDFCKNYKIPLVYASSSAIYGGLQMGDDSKNSFDLMSPYAADKFALETYSMVAWATSELSSIGLRFFNVYGPRQDPDNPYSGVISLFMKNALSNKELYINGGNQTRDFVYVTDVADVINRAILKLKYQKLAKTVNVLTGRSVTINYLAESLIKITGTSSKVIYKSLPIGDPLASDGTIQNLESLFNIKTSNFIPLELGLEKTLDNFVSGVMDID